MTLSIARIPDVHDVSPPSRCGLSPEFPRPSLFLFFLFLSGGTHSDSRYARPSPTPVVNARVRSAGPKLEIWVTNERKKTELG